MKPSQRLYALGNALVDTFVSVEDALLTKHALIKGGMHLIETQEAMTALLQDVLQDAQCLRQAGGSAGNVATFYARLGGEAHFIGAIGEDTAGEHLQKDMEKHGVEASLARDSERITGQCLVLLTPDAQRTMCTFLGAGAFCRHIPDKISPGLLYLEGYIWDSDPLKTTAQRMLQIFFDSTHPDAGVVLNLSDALCVERHRQAFETMLPHLAILSGNQQEMCALTQQKDPLETLRSLRSRVPLIMMTAGKDGIYIADKTRILHQKTACHRKVEDTTGAGDACVAGFLYGRACGQDIPVASWIGQKLANIVITQQGTRPPIATDFLAISPQEHKHIKDVTQQI